jgi:hypothetical protein
VSEARVRSQLNEEKGQHHHHHASHKFSFFSRRAPFIDIIIIMGVAAVDRTPSLLPLRKAKVAAITKMIQSASEDQQAVFGRNKKNGGFLTNKKMPTSKAAAGRVTAKNKTTRTPIRRAVRAKSPISVMNIPCATTIAREIRDKSTPPGIRGGRHTKRETFPVKLFNLLEGGEHKQAIDWSKDGDAFVIKDKAMFEKVLPKAGFSHKKLRSFHRQCSYWCFQRRTPRTNNNVPASVKEEWYHPSFVKGMRRSSLTNIIRMCFKGHSVRKEGITIPLKGRALRMGEEDVESGKSPTAIGRESTKQKRETFSSSVSAKAIPFPTNVQGVIPRRIDFFDQRSEDQQESGSVFSSFFMGTKGSKKKPVMMVADHIDGGVQEVEAVVLSSSSKILLPNDEEEIQFFNKPRSLPADHSHFEEEIPSNEEEVEDFLRTLPIYDTGIDSTDDEDCMSLQDFFSIADQILVGGQHEEEMLTAPAAGIV